jgi:predicted transcriptional regulator
MTTVKSEVIAMIQQMPEDIDVPDIMAELYFKQKVDAGLRELDDGSGIPHSEVKGRLNKWLK